jgi:hypothetical protein
LRIGVNGFGQETGEGVVFSPKSRAYDAVRRYQAGIEGKQYLKHVGLAFKRQRLKPNIDISMHRVD